MGAGATVQNGFIGVAAYVSDETPMEVSVHPFSVLLRRPLETASGSIERRDGVLVRVESGGVAGVGEATPLPGWTETLAACTRALESARGRLGSVEPETVLATLDRTPAARHGLALALADLEARTVERPLYRYLGRRGSVKSVPANATVGGEDVADTVSAARDAVAAGFDCLKVKVGAGPVPDDVDRLAAVRDAVGQDVTLRADANGAWIREEAREALDAFAELAVEYVEQPLEPGDLEGHADLRGGGVGIAVDETLATTDPSTVVEAGAADVLMVKPMVLGGLDRALDVIRLAETAGLSTVVTTTIDAVVARAEAVHLTACIEEPAPAGLATAGWLADDVATDPAPIVDGRANVPQSSGHGVRIEGWSP